MVKSSAKNLTKILQSVSESINEQIKEEFTDTATVEISPNQTITINVGEGASLNCKGDFGTSQTITTSTRLIQAQTLNLTTDQVNNLISKIADDLNQQASNGIFSLGDKSVNTTDIENYINEAINTDDFFNALIQSNTVQNPNQNTTINLDKDATIFASGNCDFIQNDISKAQVYQTMSAAIKVSLKDSEMAEDLAKVSQSASNGALSGGCSGTDNFGSMFSIIFSAIAVGIIVTIIIFIIKYGLGGAVSGHTRVQVVEGGGKGKLPVKK